MLPEELPFFANGREPVRVPPIASASFTYTSERDGVGASLVVRLLAGALAFLAAITMALTPVPATAVELPPAGNQYWIQTNGPNAAVTLGDWYTSGVAGGGAGYHYVQFQVPCGWPAATPISVDLFSPEENRVAGGTPTHEEPNGNYDSTQFELYGPGATVGPGYANPAPGAGIAGTRTTYQPGAPGVAESWVRFATLSAPVACGSYVLRSQVLTVDPANPGGTGDDQNGWKLRVGNDNDANPNNATPANYDNPDGVAGTNDELMIGMAQVSFQQSSGAVACQTFYEYTTPGQASATFNNFDMDGNTRLRYYAPGDPAYDPNANAGGTLGTLSGNGIWNNGGTLAGRVGDTIVSPTTGWWRIVNCLSDGNQLIQEGQPGVLAYYTQPPTPSMTLTKTDARGDRCARAGAHVRHHGNEQLAGRRRRRREQRGRHRHDPGGLHVHRVLDPDAGAGFVELLAGRRRRHVHADRMDQSRGERRAPRHRHGQPGRDRHHHEHGAGQLHRRAGEPVPAGDRHRRRQHRGLVEPVHHEDGCARPGEPRAGGRLHGDGEQRRSVERDQPRSSRTPCRRSTR